MIEKGPVIWQKEHLAEGMTKQSVIEWLGHYFQHFRHNEITVSEAMIFGSFNTPEFSFVHSDLDLIIVAETEIMFHHRILCFNELFDKIRRLDLLVYTPAEWSVKKKEKSGFWKSVHRSLLKVY